MAGAPQATVTPAGIRDGDPAALAALVERRASAVLAYCEATCPPGVAERAAAEAFARFRAAVAAAGDPRALDPNALLLGATRHAAASLTPVPPAPPAPAGGVRARLRGGPEREAPCAEVPELLATRAEGALAPDDRARLERHLARHPGCQALADAVARAEAVYAAPPARTVPIGALTEIMLALAAAAPNTAAAEPEPEHRDVDPPRMEGSIDNSTGAERRDVDPAPPGRTSDDSTGAERREVDPPRHAGSIDDSTQAEREGDTATDVVPATERRPARRRSAQDVLLRYVLPLLVVGAALLASFAAAGWFDTDDPEPRSGGMPSVTTAAPGAVAP